jgi:hypothetical protein
MRTKKHAVYNLYNITNATLRWASTATFCVEATGALPLSYFWRCNSSFIPGATNACFTTNNVPLSANGNEYCCLVSNRFGSVVSSNAWLILSANLVLNGGFELGSFADWTEGGNFEGCLVTSDSFYVHSGTYGAQLGPVGSLGYLSQVIPTVIGGSYLISCWLSSDGGITNEFLVSWNGVTLFNGFNLPDTGWTNLQFAAPATSTNTLLEFGFRDDPGYLGLDDISVVPLSSYSPALQAVVVSNGYVSIGWTGTAGVSYQVQSLTNLAQTNWINVGFPIAGSDTNMSFTDLIGTNQQRFYRIILEP